MSDADRQDEFEPPHHPPDGAPLDGELADHLAIEDAIDEGQAGEQPAPPPAAPPTDGPRHARDQSARPRSAQPGDASEDEPATRRGRRHKKHKKAPWWELPALALFAVLIAILVKTFVVQPFYIPSQSMEKTLHGCPGCSGDRILVNKPIYDLRDPHPGDIVVFHAPDGWDDEPVTKPPSNPIVRTVRGFGQLIGFVPPDDLVLVKRVIAVGGQTVKGDASGHVMISTHGAAGPWRTLNEPFVYEDGPDSHAAFGPVTVPAGRLWVMGDHRNDSADSRFHCDASGSGSNDGQDCDAKSATVPIDKVIGKAAVIAWPPSRWRTLGTPSTFEHAALSAGGAAPAAGSMALVLPIWFVRRRRRRSRRA
ncbi:MAG: signal peptidase I [Jatrophihabitantaceae bacterium]